MFSKKNLNIVCFVLFVSCLMTCATIPKKHATRLNDIQVIGSHNSYKVKIQDELLGIIKMRDSALAKSLEYEHATLIEQLNLGLRSLELDVYYDPNGGHYSNPMGQKALADLGVKAQSYDDKGTLNQPGLKVFHVQDIDFRSHQLLFKDNLKLIRAWSKNNPDHLPLFILINAKDQQIEPLSKPMKFTAEALASIDREIGDVFDISQLITPDYVRGDHKTLEEAILHQGWPTLKDSRGKLLFFLDVGEDKRSLYLENHPSLRDRIMFINVKEGSPSAAFRLLNNPVDDFDYIARLVKKGYIVRTRADADTYEARTGDYTRFNKAQTSGAQVISTDYYFPSRFFSSKYAVKFKNKGYSKIKAKGS